MHLRHIRSCFGVHMFCTPRRLALCINSKKYKHLGVEKCPLQHFCSGPLCTPTLPKEFECTLFHSKLDCMKYFSLCDTNGQYLLATQVDIGKEKRVKWWDLLGNEVMMIKRINKKNKFFFKEWPAGTGVFVGALQHQSLLKKGVM